MLAAAPRARRPLRLTRGGCAPQRRGRSLSEPIGPAASPRPSGAALAPGAGPPQCLSRPGPAPACAGRYHRAQIGRSAAARASDADLGSRGPGSRRRRFASWSPPRTARIMVLEERCCFFTVSLRWKCTPTESSRRGVPRLPSTTPPALAAAVAQSSAAHRRQPQRAVVHTLASDPRSRLGARVKNLVPGRVPDARPAPGHVIRMCIPFWVTARRLPP